MTTGVHDQFMFNLKAANGQIILTSQRYQEKGSAQKGIESVKAHAVDDAYFELKTSAQGEPYFVLKAANGQIVGTSEMYTSAAAMEKGIESLLLHMDILPRRKHDGGIMF